MATIYPTHTCFDDALEYVAAIESLPLLFEHVVVHAICVTPEGEPYAHAWVEHKGDAIQAGILHGQRIYYCVERAELYEMSRVVEITRYHVRQAAAENMRTGNTGPWLPKYRELCSAERRVWQSLRHPGLRYECRPEPGHDGRLGDCVDDEIET